MRSPVVPMFLVPVLVLAACAGGGAAAPTGAGHGDGGTLVVASEYREPPPGEPISIGGYGFFASVGGAEGPVEIPFDGELRLDVAAGSHELVVQTRPRSDVATIVDGEERFEYDEPTATCTLRVDVPADRTAEVRHVATGGNTCELEVAGD